MTSRFLVCPYSHDLISRLRGRSLVLRINKLDEISQATEDAERFQFHIHCCQVTIDIPLANIPLREDWKKVPLALIVPGLGRFRDFINQLSLMRQLNLRVYIPTDSEENYTAIRILSSLGIESAVVFKGQSLNWELVSDLMTYALLGVAPHAPIEPFNYIASRYNRCQRTDYSAVYFRDPLSYLHVDERGRVALSQEDITEGKFILKDITQLGELDQCTEYMKALEDWRSVFLEDDGCAYCQGWRVCLGKLSNAKKGNYDCRNFFTELMDVVEQYQSIKGQRRLIWQP